MFLKHPGDRRITVGEPDAIRWFRKIIREDGVDINFGINWNLRISVDLLTNPCNFSCKIRAMVLQYSGPGFLVLAPRCSRLQRVRPPPSLSRCGRPSSKVCQQTFVVDEIFSDRVMWHLAQWNQGVCLCAWVQINWLIFVWRFRSWRALRRRWHVWLQRGRKPPPVALKLKSLEPPPLDLRIGWLFCGSWRGIAGKSQTQRDDSY